LWNEFWNGRAACFAAAACSPAGRSASKVAERLSLSASLETISDLEDPAMQLL